MLISKLLDILKFRFGVHGKIIICDNIEMTNCERYNRNGGQKKCNFVVRNNAELIIGNNVGISSTTIFCSTQSNYW